MMLGEAAGMAAALALENGKAVQEIDASALLAKLVSQGGILNRKQVKLP